MTRRPRKVKARSKPARKVAKRAKTSAKPKARDPLDDFIMTFFVAGPGSTTLPVYIFSAIKAGVTPEINAISTLMLVISIVLVVLSYWLGQRGKPDA